ncbi:anchored repeat ABC transporter, substrate-binding protein [Corynebacterium cystitidis]|uniref:anchored repeat ABC transporter, substrate-binding protein n=1 Tax=Corynebacterium cystitidis TaxID=35757 RepID=UPI00358DA872
MVLRRGIAVVACASVLAGCATTNATQPSRTDEITDVVATTPIIADLARNIAGDQARVTQIIPNGSDPHTFEPTLRSVRNIANADVALINGLLLEPQALTRTVHATVPDNIPVVEVAEDMSRHGGQHIALVENVALDTVWLGMRVIGYGQEHGGSSASNIALRATDVRGPGHASAYVTGTFGEPEVYFNSRDGLDDDDETQLAPNAHTHVSWAFSDPGVYEIDFSAKLQANDSEAPVDIGCATITVAAGVDPATAVPGAHVIDSGHVDVAVDVDAQEVLLVGDAPEGTETRYRYNPDDTVIAVPTSTLQEIPGEPAYRFLGDPGDETYMLPQAVLGKHVHGEVDPHVWHSVANASAMVLVIRDALSQADPSGAAIYHHNAENYLSTLEGVDQNMRAAVDSIDPARRKLVTTHHGYAYLEEAYGLEVAGFVTPNPDIEPSPRDLIALTRTLENLHVPAVFLEPAQAMRETALSLTADRLGIDTCPIYGDTFDPEGGAVTTYIDLMNTNADAFTRCLGKQNNE